MSAKRDDEIGDEKTEQNEAEEEQDGRGASEQWTTGIQRETGRRIMWSPYISEDISNFKSSYFNKYFLVWLCIVSKSDQNILSSLY